MWLLTLLLCSSQSTALSSRYQPLVLGGLPPNGWTITYAGDDILDEIFLSMDVGSLGELKSIPLQRSVFESGLRRNNTQIGSLKDLGKGAVSFSAKNPLYHYYVDAFEDIGSNYEKQQKGLFDEHPVGEYLSTIIEDLLSLNMPPDIIRESSLVMDIFMRAQTYLEKVLGICTSSISFSKDPLDALISLDHVAALWIGFGQPYGDNDSGSMLYNLAERAGVNFGQDQGEVSVNTEILALMSQLRTTFEALLSSSPSIPPCTDIRRKVTRIQALFYVPLVQNLIHHMWNGEGNFVELYTLSILPLLRTCDPNSFDTLMNELVLKAYDASSLNYTLTQVQRLYTCMGIQCDDVGDYLQGIIPRCADTKTEPQPTFWQGYNISSDSALKFGKVDRDIRQIDILLQRNEYDLAMDLYLNGRNMWIATDNNDDAPITLQYMATQRWSDTSSFLNLFQDMFGLNYSQTFMTAALSDYESVANKELALRLLQVVITPHFAFNNFFDSITSCASGVFDRSIQSWDIGSTIILGSIPKGSDSSLAARFRTTWYSLAQEMCQFFGCNSILVNLFSLHLGLGRSAIDSKNCTDLQQHLETLKSILFVPFIQGTLHYSLELENNSTDPVVIGSAHAFALAIEPLVHNVSSRASQQIRNRLVSPSTNDTTGIAEDVFKALARSWYGLGVDCSLIATYISFSTSFCALIDSVEPETTNSPTASPVTASGAYPTWSPSLSPYTNVDLLDPSFSRQYNFTFNVTDEALLALDLSNMSSSNLTIANDIYAKSLSGINNNASSFQQTNPYYSFYRFAFRNDPNFPNHSVQTYSSVIVNEALTKSTGSFASETILVMVIWMHVTNLLYSAVADCKQHIVPVLNIDKALALYIGSGQRKGKSDGFMLYALSQKFAKEYNTLGEDGEASANRQVLDSFAKAKQLSRQCMNQNAPQWVELRQVVQDIIAQMNIPLLQALDYYLSLFPVTWDEDDGNHLELFALAVLPQMAVCYPLLYERFFQTALIDAPFTVTTDAEKVALSQTLHTARMKLKTTYSCFGTNSAEVLGIDGDFSNPWDENLSVAALEFSYIDRDIAKIDALLHFEATTLAQELYQYGFSSPSLSLQAMARDTDRASTFMGADQNLDYKSFVKFFSDEFYADSIILSAFHLETHPSSIHTTTMQPNTTIYKAAQTMVLFMGSLQHMHAAINLCRNSTVQKSQFEWDRAFGLFLGSPVRPDPESPYPVDKGHSLYALAKEFCEKFNTCSDVDKIIDAFVVGTNLLGQQSCNDALQLTENIIKPSLMTPMIQATIESSIEIENSTGANDNMFAFAAGNVYALSVIPLVNAIDANAAKTVSLNMGVDANALFSAFKSVLPSLHINCTNIHEATLMTNDCDSLGLNNTTSSVVYRTSSNVTNLARIDLDVKLMLDALSKDEIDLAKIVYSDGFYSMKPTGKWNLADFSLQAPQIMVNESTFNFFKFALSDDYGKYQGVDVGVFGDTVVRSFFNASIFDLKANYQSLPVEAAVALNLWLYVAHHLHSAVAACRNGAADVSYIDAAAAYWIGSLPLAGNSTQGYLLYSLTENAGSLFMQKSAGGPSATNKKLLRLFKQASILLSSPRACQDGTTTMSHLRSVVIQSISQMSIPLIQHLIANLKVGDRPRVKIYAHAVVPLLVGCRSSTFKYLKSKLLEYSYSDADVEEMINKIEGAYDCLDLSCEDIGSYQGIKTCVDITADTPLAGFAPTTDVRAISKLDLDVKEIEIMLMMGVPSLARDVYMMGKHCPSIITTGGNDFVSLYSLATDTGRDIVPDYNWFVIYYGDENYAHTMISNVIRGYNNLSYSRQQGSLLIRNTLSYLVLPMASLQRFYGSISLCNNGGLTSARTLWNEAAAMLIGSLEGNSEKGISDYDGYLAHFWANYLCEPYGVCDMGYSRVNHVIMILLNTGRAALEARQCSIVEEHVTQISKKMLIPFIQGSLFYSSANGLIHSSDSEIFDFLHTSGYISSRFVLPYVYSVDRHGASLLDRYLNFDMESNHDRNSNIQVFQVFEDAITKLTGVDCSDVGYLNNIQLGVCPGKLGDPKALSGGSFDKLWVWSLLFFLLMTAFLWFLWRKKRKPTVEVNENRPKDEEEISFPNQPAIPERQID